MAEENSKSLDIFGIKPVSDAISQVTKATVEGASAFLGRICLPAAEELGLLLKDKVRTWRSNNAVNMISYAQIRYSKYHRDDNAHAHPRLIASALEHGSWSDDKIIQEMWGGLLASSCTEDGRDENNLIFITLLSQLTSVQVRLLNYACEKIEKNVDASGLVLPMPEQLIIDIVTLNKITSIDDIQHLDQALDHLRSLDLIYSGILTESPGKADITPTALALNLYVRSQGFSGSVADYFGLSRKNKPKGSM